MAIQGLSDLNVTEATWPGMSTILREALSDHFKRQRGKDSRHNKRGDRNVSDANHGEEPARNEQGVNWGFVRAGKTLQSQGSLSPLIT